MKFIEPLGKPKLHKQPYKAVILSAGSRSCVCIGTEQGNCQLQPSYSLTEGCEGFGQLDRSGVCHMLNYPPQTEHYPHRQRI